MRASKMYPVPTFRGNPTSGFEMNGSRISADGSITNWIVGIVRSQYVGLVQVSVRIRVSERTGLRARWPIGKGSCCTVGWRIVAMIPAEAVRLEPGIFCRSRQRWNRWIGRIVLVESRDTDVMYTVKVHGLDWTLKSCGPVLGAVQPCKTWDVVNVVVDPQRVHLAIAPKRRPYRETDRMAGSHGII